MTHPVRSYLAASAASTMIAIVLACLGSLTGALHAAQRTPAPGRQLRFAISFPAAAHQGPITGRVYVMVTRTIEKIAEPRLQIGRTGVPFFGRDVEKLSPGQMATIDQTDLGTPIESVNDIPPGDYYVQAMVNVYSE